MYLTTIARSLGNYRPLPSDPGPPRLPPPRTVPKCGRVRLPNGQIIFIDCNKPAKSLGTTAACSDAGTGLLIDCWRQAEQRGLGIALDQAQLSQAATSYQRITRPNSLAGWVRSGNRMVWQRSGLGDGVITPASYETPPDPFTIAQQQPSKAVDLTKWFPPVVPAVTPDFLLRAASLPNAPAVVKQAAAQLPPQQASMGAGITDWLTAEMISGIPNYALLGAGVVVVMLLSKRRGR
jgi:hypothetical protein